MYSRSAELAIRGLVHLARLPKGTSARAREIAMCEQLPASLMAKALQDLVNRGFLGSKRGRDGGFLLMREPEGIALMDVIGAIDGMPPYDRCAVVRREPCCPGHPCSMHQFWNNIRPAIETYLRERTIADLAARHCRAVPQDSQEAGKRQC